MTPDYARAIDPVFSYVLRLQDRIVQGESVLPPEEQPRIRSLIDKAESSIGESKEWRLAKYAVVAWVDETLVDASFWEGADWWTNHVLEWDLFNTMDRFHLFYERARDASAAGYRNALEVYYLAVVLGFRGLYKDEHSDQLAAARELPETLERWATQTANAIRVPSLPPPSDNPKPIVGAPPLTGQALLISSSMLGAALAAVVLAVLFLYVRGS